MPTISPRTKRFVGYSLIASIWICLLPLLAIFALVSAVYLDLSAPQRFFFTRGFGLEKVSRQLYLDYFRPIWQHQADCMSYDPDLVYVPRIGVARYHGPEFDVNITSDASGGRSQPMSTGGKPLVVVAGDSQAMGWGVGDQQTFSAILASEFGFNTFNSAVPSYGTAREFVRLRKLNLLSRASVLVVQYCDNDADENHTFVSDPGFIQKRDPRGMFHTLIQFKQPPFTYQSVAKQTLAYLQDRAKSGGYIHLLKELWSAKFEPTGTIVEATQPASVMASDFLQILDSFQELTGKPIIVFEVSGYGTLTGFTRELHSRIAQRPNIILLKMPFQREDFFRFDDHLNPTGHRKVAAQVAEALRPIIK